MTLGVFEIIGSLGAGGMGEVYRARDTKLNRDVAIKVLPEAFAQDTDRLARFTREAQTLAALNHPNIAQIYGIEGGALVMELVEGDDLSTIIAGGAEAPPLRSAGAPGLQPRGMPLADVLPIARQIADALEAAHELGIVHRDLKPANIKVRADNTVKVLDFGLAKALVPNAASASADPANSPTLTGHATQLGMILGTAAYMAPEQARGKAVDRRADIWAFGVVVYEMLTGRRMFAGGEVTDVLAAVLRQDIDWNALPAATPPRLRRLLERCLDRDVKQRLRDIGEARVELAKIENGASDLLSVMPTVEARTTAWLRLLPWAVTATALIAAVAMGVVAYRRPAASATPVWTSIPAPVRQFSSEFGPAISSDGQQVAFAARDASGKDHLWVRALDAQSARLIPQTEGAGAPFWSPDGNWLGFFTRGKLQTINTAGGSPQTLTDVLNPRGATWNRDGVILFVSGGAIYRIPAAGGGAVRLEVPSDPAVSLPMYPSFLPDGRHFLYSSFHESEFWISVGLLGTTTSTPLMRAVSRAEYANGYLLFGSKGALFAQPFDVATLALSGERIRVTDSVGFSMGTYINYSFSSSSTTIAVGQEPFLPPSRLTWFDGSGTRLGPLGEAGEILSFSVAPDRTRAVIERMNPALNSVDPWIVQLTSGFTSPLRAGSEGAAANSPIWSHDGQRIFYGDNDGLRMSPTSGGAEELWPVGKHWSLSSSPDGKFVLVTVNTQATTGADLMLVPVTGDHRPIPYVQTSFNERGGRFSPDGQSVAYVSDESGRNEVYVQSYPQPGNKVRVSEKGGGNPSWGDDGNTLYFLSVDHDRTWMMASQFRLGGAGLRRLFEVPPGYRDGGRPGYAVVDSGRRFLVNAFVPDTAPKAITIGLNWTAALEKKR